MAIVVEFYGIPRVRAGVSRTSVCDDLDTVPFGQVIAEVARRFPVFGDCCTQEGRTLLDGYIASIDGLRFVEREEEPIVASGQSVLILSADAGG